MPDATANILPNLIVAGTTKAGTTSLYAYLAQHPDVGASAVKETCYFLPLRYGDAVASLDEYRAQFAHCGDRPVRMESTGGYFAGGRQVAQRIADDLGDDVRVLVMLREPVSRFVSFYRYQQSRLGLPRDMTLAQYVDACERMTGDELCVQSNDPYYGLAGGRYADHLPDWLDVFGGRLRVLLFDDLVRDTRGLMRDVFAWCGLDTDAAEALDLTVENRTTDFRAGWLQRAALRVNDAGERFWRRHPAIKRTLREAYYRLNGRSFEKGGDDATMQRLRAYYAPHNARLAEQLRGAGYNDLPEWLTESPAHGLGDVAHPPEVQQQCEGGLEDPGDAVPDQGEE